MINYIKSGTLELHEIKEIFSGCGTVADNVWNDIIREVDANGDGLVNIRYKILIF